MGAWDLDLFEDDDALDWIAKLVESSDLVPIIEALAGVTDDEQQRPGAQDCAIALAASEIVAAINGTGIKRLPPDIREWIAEGGFTGDPNLVRQARGAVKRIAEDSELRDIWQESEDYDRWKATLVDLLRRLR